MRVLAGAGLFGLLLGALPVQAQQSGAPAGPLSAIDWLMPGAQPTANAPGLWPVTPPAPQPAEGIAVRTLDAQRPEAVGLFPAARVGLPATLWTGSDPETLSALFVALPGDMLPALRELALRLLLAEFEAPVATSPEASTRFLLARVDALVTFGALDQAAALLDALGSSDPALRLRRFDIGLLLGDEHAACAGVLLPEPPIGNDPARIFCLARGGDWAGAEALLVEGAGRMDPYMAELLTQFVHADDPLPGGATLIPPPPGTPSPLALRLREATGEPLPATSLPVAFAHADLRGTLGWRAQIEAAERLVRVGALSGNRLLGLYTERRPAASGGIWERVRAVQRLDAAVTSGDGAATGAALATAWPLMQSAELEVAMADLFAPALAPLDLGPQGEGLALHLALLSGGYETAALSVGPDAPEDTRFLAAVARGLDPAPLGLPGELAPAVALAFGPAPTLPEGLSDRLAEGRLGEEILAVLVRLGGPGDPRALAEGLAALRAMGLEDIARRTALQSLLLSRNG